MAIEQLVEYLRSRSEPTWSRRWVLFKCREPAQYPFPIRAGASPDLIDATSSRLGLAIPEDLRRSYFIMDGMDDYTGSDAGFMRLLPLAEWKLMCDEFESGYDPAFRRNVIIADYSIWAWWYAIELENPKEIGWVRSFGGGSSWVVARSFDEFIQLNLADAPALYNLREGGDAA